ncbi:MAG: hypothetical protein AVDCRST_MAG83-1826, partial [uncultured Arthrobacter sp.]
GVSFSLARAVRPGQRGTGGRRDLLYNPKRFGSRHRPGPGLCPQRTPAGLL